MVLYSQYSLPLKVSLDFGCPMTEMTVSLVSPMFNFIMDALFLLASIPPHPVRIKRLQMSAINLFVSFLMVMPYWVELNGLPIVAQVLLIWKNC